MTYEEQRAALLADLDGKRFRGDWHGVSDAANDLRVLEAEQKIRTEERDLDRPDEFIDALRYGLSAVERAQRGEVNPDFSSGSIRVGIPWRYRRDSAVGPLDPLPYNRFGH